MLPNLLFRIVEQADIRIRIDDDALFHLVVVAAPYVAVLYHFLVGDAQYPESIYQEMSQSHHLAFILMKQETQFSLFQSLTSNRNLGLVTLAEIYRLITTDAALKENAGKFRYFRAQGFDGDADRIKRSKSLVFTPAAVFDGKRLGKNRVSYTQYSLVDIDKLEEEQILKHFRIPQPGEAYEVYSVADVLGVINLELKTQLSATKVGMLLNKLGFRQTRKDGRRCYVVYRYSIEEISHRRKGTVRDGTEQELPF